MVMKMDFVKQRKEWIENNPIRKYRKENKLPLNVAASMFDVGVYTVQRWESGDVKPNEDNMQKIVKLLGEGAESQWKEWMKSKPSLE
jgi:DNA-binding transcriptional regulator YiaG